MVPDDDSMNDPVCHSAIGGMVTFDYVTPDTVFGERRPQFLDGLGNDLATGSFEEMRVKVTFSITCECISLQNINACLGTLHVTQ